MSLLRRLLRRPRLLDEAKFALGAAVIGAGAGLVVAVLALPPSAGLHSISPTHVRWFVAIAPGLGFGWWGALVWSAFLALYARRFSPPPPIAALARVTWVAATILVGAAAVARVTGSPPRWGVLAGIVAATLIARVMLARSAARATP